MIIVTDGVQAEQDWVHNHQDMVAPLNPRWCGQAEVPGRNGSGALHSYLAMWWDWGYEEDGRCEHGQRKLERKLGRRDAAWGVIDISRHDYIPMAVEDCASARNLFLAAEKPDEVKAALKQLLKTYLSVPRLTR